MPHNALQLAQRLEALTLSLESALAEDDFATVDSLLKERSRVVDGLSKATITDDVRVVLENAQRHERELLAQLATFKASVAAELGTLGKQSRAASAYRRLA